LLTVEQGETNGDLNMEEMKSLSPEIMNEIIRILKHGNSVELKKEKDKLVVVEIQRRVKEKTSMTW
jgi:hypothetical protein